MVKKIGIAGAGGLGSNVAVNLVRSGVDNIKIVDFDTIDDSNLNRQFYFKDQVGRIKVIALLENLKRINPLINIEVESKLLDKSNMSSTFKDCDYIIEAFDKSIYKSMLIEELRDKELIVCGSGIAHYDLEKIITKKVGKNIYIVGDFISDIKNKGTYSTKVQIVASHMANILMEKGGYYED